MNREELIGYLRDSAPAQFVDHVLFDRVPEVFAGDRSSFVTWKRALGDEIEVDPACITVVGSAAVGASLNPSKNFKAFDEHSDVDVAVISAHHFSVGWRYLRQNGARRLRVDERTRIAWDEHVKKFVYWGTLATDRLLGVLPFGLQWLQAISRVSAMEPARGRPMNLRIYMDYESLRSYQIQSVRSLRQQHLA